MGNDTIDIVAIKEPLAVVSPEIVNQVENSENVPINNLNVSELVAECVVMDDGAKEIVTPNETVVDNDKSAPLAEIEIDQNTDHFDIDVETDSANKSPANDRKHVAEIVNTLNEKTDKNIAVGKTANTSLGLLAQYASDSSEEDDNDEDSDIEEDDEREVEASATKQLLEKVFQQTNYRDISSDDE